jgi:putative glutathione S-transferase
MNYISDRISPDAHDVWPTEAGKYRLVVADACPWENRARITHCLLGLDDATSVGLA